MSRSFTRRQFLATASTAAFSVPMYARSAKPGEKLNIAVIGVNDRGAANLAGVAHENIVALCDVDEAWSAKAREQFPKAPFFTDYRKMFDKVSKEIDAVVVSTPDHSHAMAAALAMNLGKHVYCEKPLTPSVNETRVLQKLAHEKKLITQMGTQIHAEENYRRVVEIVQAGLLGPIKRIHVWNSSKPVGGRKVEGKPTAKFDLDLWLGPRPVEFFEAAMNKSGWNFAWPHFHWRWWWDFGGGTLADLGCHYIDLPFWALGLTAPTSVSATGKKTYAGDNIVPDVMQVDYHFPATKARSEVHLTWYHGVNGPDLEGKKVYKGFNSAVMFVGEKAQLIADYGKYQLLPDEFARDFKSPQKTIPSSIGHHKEWCEAIKTGGSTTCNFGYSGLLAETVVLGNVAYRSGKPIKWDTALGTTDSSEADSLLGHEYRKGWELPKV
ncbi:MAG TPA: Gfo/Idh/MocA family oxidoreductase [Gemmata sp.]|nr:Gfo/Idh/MocA family oxidoreductase [Gemmata sp.]